MFEKILVANRGEIAVRIIRACKELNIRTVAVYSEADANSMHVQIADEAICIGQRPRSESYLRIDRIVSAAEMTDVDAIHPGYGFLSENAHFADVCESCNIRFIGPNSRAMKALEDKAVSRALAKKVDVAHPARFRRRRGNRAGRARRGQTHRLPGHDQGHGGRRRTRDARGAQRHFTGQGLSTPRAAEAEKAFGNSGVYIEKFIENPHHIEFQILGDHKGHIIHLGERDCSIQRRNQKVVEECPSPFWTTRSSRSCGKDRARRRSRSPRPPITRTPARSSSSWIARADYYFLEMNKRIQVEHPITEEVTGIDLVRYQIMLAMGETAAPFAERHPAQGPCHRMPHQRRRPLR